MVRERAGAVRERAEVAPRISGRNRDILACLGVQPGNKIDVEKLPNGRIAVTAARPAGKIADVFDFLKRKDGPTLSIDEMNDIASSSWAGRP